MDKSSSNNNHKSKVKDDYYMDRMKEILNAFPNTGPPNYPVQLVEHIYMGNQKHADDVELLKRYGITHVLNCAGLRRYDFSRSPYPKESGIKGFLMISAIDHEDFDIASHFDEAIAFLDKVKKVNGKAFVHCNLGVNRSGAVVAAYLMAEQRKTLLEVVNYLKLKRFVILCNRGFRRQLITFARSRGLLDPVIEYCPDEKESVNLRSNNVKDKPTTVLRENVEHSKARSNRNGSAAGSAEMSVGSRRSPDEDSDVQGKKLSISKGSENSVTNKHGRFWTLPRQMPVTIKDVLKDQPPPPAPPVEVIVSEHVDDTTADAKSRAKTFQQQLMPVYETTSCDATGTSNNNSNSSGNLNGRVRTESMSAKLGGLLTLLGPKKKKVPTATLR